MDTKTCSICAVSKPLNGFYFIKRSMSHDGRCKECVRAYIKARNKADNGEAARAVHERRKAKGFHSKRWTEKTPEEKAIAYEGVRAWRNRNRDKFLAELKASIRLRRSRQYLKAWPIILAHYGNKCLSCGVADGLCFDHVVPLSKGGDNQLANGQPLCRKCNTFKGQLQEPTKDWRMDQGAWIVQLVALNPWLVIPEARKQGWHVTEEGRQEMEKRDREASRQIVMP
jgi:5-methylcytosine-specific restriction endonuclease McrA